MGRKGVDMGRNGRGERGVRAGGGGACLPPCRSQQYSEVCKGEQGRSVREEGGGAGRGKLNRTHPHQLKTKGPSRHRRWSEAKKSANAPPCKG